MIKLRRILPLIGILIFIYVIYHVGINKIIATLPGINWWYVLASIALSFIVVLLQAQKWNSILYHQGIELPFSTILHIHLISLFYGNITPGKIGSFSKIFHLQEPTKRDIGGCISSVTLERFLDLLMVATFALIGSIIALNYFTGIFVEFLILFLILLTVLLLSLNEKTREWFVWKVYKFLIPKKFKDRTLSSFNAFKETLLAPKQIIMPVILTIMVWAGIYTQTYLIAQALHMNISFLPFIFVSSIATVVTLIPITVGGIGTSEAAITVLFTRVFQTTPEIALSMAIITRIIGLIVTIIGGILSMRDEKYF